MVQNTVEAESHQSELLSWGQEQSGTHRETIFCSGTVRDRGKTLSVQSCALGHAVEVSVLGASGRPEGAGAAPKSALQAVFSHTSLPWLTFTIGSLELPKLSYRYDTELCFSSGAFLRCLKPGELTERSTPRVSKVFLMETKFFSQKCVTFGCTFYFTKIKLELSTFLKR